MTLFRLSSPFILAAGAMALAAAAPAAWAADELCKPLHEIVLAAEKDFSGLGTLPESGEERRAPGSIVLPGLDSCEIAANPDSVAYNCEKWFASKQSVKLALDLLDARIRGCRPHSNPRRASSMGVSGLEEVEYQELYPPVEAYLNMYLGPWEEQGKYVLMLEIRLDK